MKDLIAFFWTIVTFVLLFCILLLITKCHADAHPERYSSQNRPRFTKEYVIQSIRLDDDGEYHIMAVSSNGEVINLHDEDNGTDILLRYSNTQKPVVIYHCESTDPTHYIYKSRTPDVILPYGYKIETFDD